MQTKIGQKVDRQDIAENGYNYLNNQIAVFLLLTFAQLVVGRFLRRGTEVVVLTLVDGLYEEVVFRGDDRLVSSTFPTSDLTAKQVLQAGET